MLVCIKTFGRLLYSEETRVLTGWERYRCNLNWEAGRRHILFLGLFWFFLYFFVRLFLFIFWRFIWMVVDESIMQFVLLYNSTFTSVVLKAKETNHCLFCFFCLFFTLHTHSIFVLLPIHVKL